MRVKILKGDPRIQTAEGQIFEAKPYALDPATKVTLLKRIEPEGHFTMCNEYRDNIEILRPTKQN